MKYKLADREDLVEVPNGRGILIFQDRRKPSEVRVGFKLGFEAKKKLKELGAIWESSEKCWYFSIKIKGLSPEEMQSNIKKEVLAKIDEVIKQVGIFSEDKENIIPFFSRIGIDFN